jgi:hypothetical protein
MVDLVCFVSLVDLVHLVSFVQPNKRNRPNKPCASAVRRRDLHRAVAVAALAIARGAVQLHRAPFLHRLTGPASTSSG